MVRYIDDRYIEATMFCILPMQQITTKEIEIKSYKRGWNDALDAVLNSSQPADVRENVRGEWINKNKGIWNTLPVYQCSVCGDYDTRYQDTDNFCPNCGADMRGEEDE